MTLSATFVATGFDNVAEVTPNITGVPNATCFVDWDEHGTDAAAYPNIGEIHNISYSYQTFGYYNIHLVCMGPEEFETILEENKYVGTKVTTVKISNVTEHFVVPVDKASLASDVTLELVIDGGLDLRVEAKVHQDSGFVFLLNNQSNGSIPIILSNTLFKSGLYLLELNISNPLRTLVHYERISVQYAVAVDEVSFQDYQSQPYYVMAYQKSYLDASVTAGDDVYMLLMAIDPAANKTVFSEVELCSNVTNPHKLGFILNATGELIIKLTIYNNINSFHYEFNVTSLYQVNNLTFDVSDTLILMNEAIDFTITVLNTATLPMGDITCTISYSTSLQESVTFTPVHDLTKTITKSFIAGIYNVTTVCANPLPPMVYGTPSTMVFINSVIVENPVDTLTLDYGNANLTMFPLSKNLELTISNANPSTDLPLADITCLAYCNPPSTGFKDISVSGDVNSSTNLVLDIKFEEAKTNYPLEVNCSNRQTKKVFPLPSIYVYYDCWYSTELFDNAFKTTDTPLTFYTHVLNTVRFQCLYNFFLYTKSEKK